MSDEKFEEFLQREAKAYNAPPAMVPRDEMWASLTAIREARFAERTPRIVRDAAPAVVAPAQAPRARLLRMAPWIGMAATLLLGVGIGRFVLSGGEALDATRPAVQVSTDSRATSPAGATTQELPGVVDGTGSGATRDARVPNDAQPAPREVVRQPAVRRPAQLAAATTDGGSNGILPLANGAAESPYGVASQRHLASAEALVSVVAASPRDALMDSLTTKWAREMLSNTRLLLDSPAGDDQVRRRLLEDLETLLVQLVQRSGGAVDERELIDRTLQKTQLLTRLRSTTAGT
jgi:hypothetical protein